MLNKDKFLKILYVYLWKTDLELYKKNKENKTTKARTLCTITDSFPKMLWSLQRSYFPIQPFFGQHAVWYVSYQSLSRYWNTDLDYGSYRLFNMEIGLTAGVTGQQEMLTPPWLLIPPLIYSEDRTCTPILWSIFPVLLMRLNTVRYFCHFI
jgi:hypothetical protein